MGEKLNFGEIAKTPFLRILALLEPDMLH